MHRATHLRGEEAPFTVVVEPLHTRVELEYCFAASVGESPVMATQYRALFGELPSQTAGCG